MRNINQRSAELCDAKQKQNIPSTNAAVSECKKKYKLVRANEKDAGAKSSAVKKNMIYRWKNVKTHAETQAR